MTSLHQPVLVFHEKEIDLVANSWNYQNSWQILAVIKVKVTELILCKHLKTVSPVWALSPTVRWTKLLTTPHLVIATTSAVFWYGCFRFFCSTFQWTPPASVPFLNNLGDWCPINIADQLNSSKHYAQNWYLKPSQSIENKNCPINLINMVFAWAGKLS